jgi:hypothetical protein
LFCDKRKINSVCPTLNQVLEFLNSLFESGLSYSAINSARSALSAYGINCNHVLDLCCFNNPSKNIVYEWQFFSKPFKVSKWRDWTLLAGIHFNHVPVGSNAIIIRFMKGVYNVRPSEPKYCKTWDVSNVLCYLRKLSPIKFISLNDLTLKLVI